MKRSVVSAMIITVLISACATVQSIVRSTFPYIATLTIPSSKEVNKALSVTSPASSFDQILTGQGSNTTAIKDVRISSARLDATSPSGQTMSAFKTIKMYISRGDSASEVLVASRDDIGPSIGNSIMLDIDNSKLLDEYIKGSTVRVRMEYILRTELSADVTIKTILGFSVAPNTAK